MSFATLHAPTVSVYLDSTTMKSMVYQSDVRELLYQVSSETNTTASDSDASTAPLSAASSTVSSDSVSISSSSSLSFLKEGGATKKTKSKSKKRRFSNFTITKKLKKTKDRSSSPSSSSSTTFEAKQSSKSEPLTSKIRASAVAVKHAPVKVLKNLTSKTSKKKKKTKRKRKNDKKSADKLILSHPSDPYDIHRSGSLITGQFSADLSSSEASCCCTNPLSPIPESERSSIPCPLVLSNNNHNINKKTGTEKDSSKKTRQTKSKRKKKTMKKLASKVVSKWNNGMYWWNHSKKSSSSTSKASNDTLPTSATSSSSNRSGVLMTSSDYIIQPTTDTVVISTPPRHCTTPPRVPSSPVDPESAAMIQSLLTDSLSSSSSSSSSVSPVPTTDTDQSVRIPSKRPKKILDISKTGRKKWKTRSHQDNFIKNDTIPTPSLSSRDEEDKEYSRVASFVASIHRSSMDNSSPQATQPMRVYSSWRFSLLSSILVPFMYLLLQVPIGPVEVVSRNLHRYQSEHGAPYHFSLAVFPTLLTTNPLQEENIQESSIKTTTLHGIDIPTSMAMVAEPVMGVHNFFSNGQFACMLEESLPFSWV